MELLAIVLSSVIGLVSPTGWVLESTVENAIRDQLDHAESLSVRIDNAPSHQLLRGQVDRVRIAGQGLYPLAGVRVDYLALETDPIDVNTEELRDGSIALDAPFRMAMQLQLTEADLNRALESPVVVDYLQTLSENWFGDGFTGYEFVDPQIEFLPDQRLRVSLSLADRAQESDPLAIAFAVTVELESSYQLNLLDPELIVNNEPFPDDFVEPVIMGLSQQLDLRQLEESGLTPRILALSLNSTELDLVGFVQVTPDAFDE